ncbi:MAG: hypothetical protein ACLFQW_11440, partial [Spirochaetaceae bacterium]
RMTKKLTITLDENVYQGLKAKIGPGRISHFIENLVRPHVLNEELEKGYAEMAQDSNREEEAWKWSEALICDGNND